MALERHATVPTGRHEDAVEREEEEELELVNRRGGQFRSIRLEARREESYEEGINKADRVQDDARTEGEGRKVDVRRAEGICDDLGGGRREGGPGSEERGDGLSAEYVRSRL